jgi:hypothetical protein
MARGGNILPGPLRDGHASQEKRQTGNCGENSILYHAHDLLFFNSYCGGVVDGCGFGVL